MTRRRYAARDVRTHDLYSSQLQVPHAPPVLAAPVGCHTLDNVLYGHLTP